MVPDRAFPAAVDTSIDSFQADSVAILSAVRTHLPARPSSGSYQPNGNSSLTQDLARNHVRVASLPLEISAIKPSSVASFSSGVSNPRRQALPVQTPDVAIDGAIAVMDTAGAASASPFSCCWYTCCMSHAGSNLLDSQRRYAPADEPAAVVQMELAPIALPESPSERARAQVSHARRRNDMTGTRCALV